MDTGGGVAAGVATVFKKLSALRGKRIFHPFGVGLRGTLTPVGPPTGALALDEPRPITVRLSRALGLPEALPDLWGIAIRVPDAFGPGRHQDVLLASSGSASLGRHCLLPARSPFARPYSSVLPYRLGGELVVVGARATTKPAARTDLATLDRGDQPRVELELAIAPPRGDWRPVARLTLEERVSREETEVLDMDPTNSGGGLEPAGWLNRLRGPSYRASQEGRGLP
jgi:hypothetical protein